MTAQLAEAYVEEANGDDMLVIPAGLAVARAMRERPDLVYHQPDKRHPTLITTYLSACTAFAALTGKSPVGNRYTGGVDAQTVVVTADRMVDVVAGRIVARPQITIANGRISAVGEQGAARVGEHPPGAAPDPARDDDALGRRAGQRLPGRLLLDSDGGQRRHEGRRPHRKAAREHELAEDREQQRPRAGSAGLEPMAGRPLLEDCHARTIQRRSTCH